MAVNVATAHREAVDRLCRARPAWTAMRPAREALAPLNGAGTPPGIDVRKVVRVPRLTWPRAR